MLKGRKSTLRHRENTMPQRTSEGRRKGISSQERGIQEKKIGTGKELNPEFAEEKKPNQREMCRTMKKRTEEKVKKRL